jgi:pimeloyl-ACP methyl ester carboxylesterase
VSLALGLDEGSGPLVVLLHGFPEGPESWHHQVPPLVADGYRVVAPHLRGYGDSPAPTDPGQYTADLLADDVAGVIEDCGEEQAVVIGHDWGAAVTWAAAELRPDRVRAMAALSVPFTARSRRPPLERLAEVAGGNFFYMLYFNEPDGRAERELGADVAAFLLGMYAAASGEPPPGAFAPLRRGASMLDQLVAPESWPAWLDREVFSRAVDRFTAHGFTGPLNYYRAMDLSWERVPAYGAAPVTCPALFLAGAKDMVLAFTPTRAMAPPLVTDLRVDLRVAGAGHWVQQEAAEQVTAALRAFLAGLAR